MKELLKSKKMLAFLLGVVAVTVLVLAGTDLEVLKYAGGFISGMAGLFCLGQGLSDGLSEGRTSARGR